MEETNLAESPWHQGLDLLRLDRLDFSKRTSEWLLNQGIRTPSSFRNSISRGIVPEIVRSEIEERITDIGRLPSEFLRETRFLQRRFGPEGGESINNDLLSGLAQAATVEAEVMALVRILDSRSQEIVLSRWRFYNRRKTTYAGLGKEFGVTRQRIRQIYKSAIDKLRDLYLPLVKTSRVVEAGGLEMKVNHDNARRLSEKGIHVSEQGMRVSKVLVDEGFLWPSIRRTP